MFVQNGILLSRTMQIGGVLFLSGLSFTGWSAPTLSNISVAQRTDGSGYVDIYYTLSDAVGDTVIEVQISSDNGDTWNITPDPAHLSGDVGAGVDNGTNRHIEWNMKADAPGICWPQCRARILANDEAPDIRDDLTIMLPNSVPLVLVWVPAGSFEMGRYTNEQDSLVRESPQHPVTISPGFYMGKTEVTQQQWLALMESWPGAPPSSTYGLGVNYPAYNISWEDAQNYITALNAHIAGTSQGLAAMRLPTEAEWEYACRAGTQTRYYWGNDPSYSLIGNNAWYTINSGSKTRIVAGKAQNTFKLYDMNGNVWEWCQDYYGDYPSSPVTNPTGPATGTERVLRGGSWSSAADRCRSAFRSYAMPTERTLALGFGFRLVRSP